MKKHILIILLIGFSSQGQKLHHHMLSSQGAIKVLPNEIIVKQTLGQQSLTGTSTNNDYVVIQGFQQSVWSKYIASSKSEEANGIKITTYPNPFTETINFQFSEPITDMVSILVYDILGRVVYQQDKMPINNLLTINLAMLPSTKYLVLLKTLKLNYYTQIIKK